MLASGRSGTCRTRRFQVQYGLGCGLEGACSSPCSGFLCFHLIGVPQNNRREAIIGASIMPMMSSHARQLPMFRV